VLCISLSDRLLENRTTQEVFFLINVKKGNVTLETIHLLAYNR